MFLFIPALASSSLSCLCKIYKQFYFLLLYIVRWMQWWQKRTNLTLAPYINLRTFCTSLPKLFSILATFVKKFSKFVCHWNLAQNVPCFFLLSIYKSSQYLWQPDPSKMNATIEKTSTLGRLPRSQKILDQDQEVFQELHFPSPSQLQLKMRPYSTVARG